MSCCHLSLMLVAAGFAEDERCLAIPLLLLMRLRRLGFCEFSRVLGSDPGPLALRPRLPRISCARACFFLRSRDSLMKSVKETLSAIATVVLLSEGSGWMSAKGVEPSRAGWLQNFEGAGRARLAARTPMVAPWRNNGITLRRHRKLIQARLLISFSLTLIIIAIMIITHRQLPPNFSHSELIARMR